METTEAAHSGEVSRPKRPERRELWRQRITQQQASGQSVRDFCRKHDFSEQPFYTWRKALGSSATGATAKPPVAFALVEMNKPSQATPIEFILTGGEILRIPPDAATLRLVLDALQSRKAA